jgi:hypothetical protein
MYTIDSLRPLLDSNEIDFSLLHASEQLISTSPFPYTESTPVSIEALLDQNLAFKPKHAQHIELSSYSKLTLSQYVQKQRSLMTRHDNALYWLFKKTC